MYGSNKFTNIPRVAEEKKKNAQLLFEMLQWQ